MKLMADGLYKSFDGNPVLEGVSFAVQSGETLAIAGGRAAEKPPCCASWPGFCRRIPAP